MPHACVCTFAPAPSRERRRSPAPCRRPPALARRWPRRRRSWLRRWRRRTSARTASSASRSRSSTAPRTSCCRWCAPSWSGCWRRRPPCWKATCGQARGRAAGAQGRWKEARARGRAAALRSRAARRCRHGPSSRVNAVRRRGRPLPAVSPALGRLATARVPQCPRADRRTPGSWAPANPIPPTWHALQAAPILRSTYASRAARPRR